MVCFLFFHKTDFSQTALTNRPKQYFVISFTLTDTRL